MSPEDIAKLPYRPCVGVMLANANGELFVGQRIDSEVDAWQMPQGGIDKGETSSAAALRELWEETGVTADLVTVLAETEDWLTYDLPHDIVPRIWKGRYRGQKQKWVLLRYHGADAQVSIDRPHPEFREWRWLDPDAVLEQIVPFKRAVYATALSALRRYL